AGRTPRDGRRWSTGCRARACRPSWPPPSASPIRPHPITPRTTRPSALEALGRALRVRNGADLTVGQPGIFRGVSAAMPPPCPPSRENPATARVLLHGRSHESEPFSRDGGDRAHGGAGGSTDRNRN